MEPIENTKEINQRMLQLINEQRNRPYSRYDDFGCCNTYTSGNQTMLMDNTGRIVKSLNPCGEMPIGEPQLNVLVMPKETNKYLLLIG